MVEAAAARGVPLQVVDICHAAAAEAYGKRLVLVRPDGHVAWRGDAEPGRSRARHRHRARRRLSLR